MVLIKLLEFKKKNNSLLVSYKSDYPSSQWIEEKLKRDGFVWFSKVFKVTEADLTDKQNSFGINSYSFVLAKKLGQYYKVKNNILDLNNSFYLHHGLNPSRKIFIAERNISILRKIDQHVDNDVYIGGNKVDSIPLDIFNDLLKNFPNSTELNKYASSRIDIILGEYLDFKKDYTNNYNEYLDKKISLTGENISNSLANIEVQKFQVLINKLKEMLINENGYSEKQWQTEILDILLLLFPKYVHIIDEAPVINKYTGSKKRIDFLLVDASGNIDIVEIKKPRDQHIITKRTYRDNHIPLRDLSGTIMQVEKYLYYLNKSGDKGEKLLEKEIYSKSKSQVNINIINPGAIIIMGRDHLLTSDQMSDFELIRRKYKNVMDIITYDDLLNRLNAALNAWKDRF